jgi:non-heme chloroperoxidase
MVCIEEKPAKRCIPVGPRRKVFAQVEGGRNRTIVLVHGWGLNHDMWRCQIPALKRHYKVVAIDLRGFGDSSKPLAGYSYETWAKDIGEVIRYLKLKHVTLAGYSLGGAIAMYYVSMGIEPAVDRIALIAAAGPCMTKCADRLGGQDRQFFKDHIDRIKTGRKLHVFEQFYAPTALPTDPKVWTWLLKMLDSASIPALVSGLTEMRNWDLTDEVGNISVGEKTRIFHGIEDELVPFEFAEEQQELITGSKLVSFKNGHLLFYNERDDLSRELCW